MRRKLWAGFSPSIVPAVRATQSAPWSFAFIDGYHEGRAPLDDAEAVSPFMADDACVMFHDLISPHVAAGLGHFADAGWSVGLYNTMQIMGIAWRGAARPFAHVADRNMPAIEAGHLRSYRVFVERGVGALRIGLRIPTEPRACKMMGRVLPKAEADIAEAGRLALRSATPCACSRCRKSRRRLRQSRARRLVGERRRRIEAGLPRFARDAGLDCVKKEPAPKRTSSCDPRLRHIA